MAEKKELTAGEQFGTIIVSVLIMFGGIWLFNRYYHESGFQHVVGVTGGVIGFIGCFSIPICIKAFLKALFGSE